MDISFVHKLKEDISDYLNNLRICKGFLLSSGLRKRFDGIVSSNLDKLCFTFGNRLVNRLFAANKSDINA